MAAVSDEPTSTGDEAIARAAETLLGGSVVAHPTSTVYGLGGRPDPRVDSRIARIKGRSDTRLIRLVASRADVASVFPELRWSELAERLAFEFWPGPLTLVLDDGGEDGTAVRVDSHPVVLALLGLAGGAMTSTSLNATSRPPATTAEHARLTLNTLDLAKGRGGWLDAGDLGGGPASTVVSLQGDVATILREGAIRSSEIEEAIA